MSTCDHAAIEGLVYGGLASDAASALRTHFASCPRCTEEYAALVRERRLFGERRGLVRSVGPVPDFEAILIRAKLTPTSESASGFLRRAIVGVLASGSGRRSMGRTVAAAAVASLCLFGLARNHAARPPSDISGDRPSARPCSATSIESHASGDHGVASTLEATTGPCFDEEGVCRQVRGVAWQLDRAVTPVSPIEKPALDWSAEKTISALPSPRAYLDTEAMCVADAI